MNYKEAKEAISDAENTLLMADMMMNDVIILLPGRLRKIEGHLPIEKLCDVKRELRDFNINTKQWKK